MSLARREQQALLAAVQTYVGDIIDQDLPADLLSRLDTYLSKHIALEQGTTPLPMSLTRASLSAAANDHVGAFTLVVADLSVVLCRTKDVFPLKLFYDAVMHEIRSHSATVHWVRPGATPLGIAEFRYKSVNGRPKPILLNLSTKP